MPYAERLRPKWSDEQLREIYAKPHDHRIYGRGHGERVEKTIEMGLLLSFASGQFGSIESGADLSCGNGAILNALPIQDRRFGDFAPGYEYQGPIEWTVTQIPHVDLFICSETIEHLDDPRGVLALIPARYLLLSTPLEAWGDTNAEHYWAWDRAHVEDLMRWGGWSPLAFDNVDSREYGEPYNYGIWLAMRS